MCVFVCIHIFALEHFYLKNNKTLQIELLPTYSFSVTFISTIFRGKHYLLFGAYYYHVCFYALQHILASLYNTLYYFIFLIL